VEGFAFFVPLSFLCVVAFVLLYVLLRVSRPFSVVQVAFYCTRKKMNRWTARIFLRCTKRGGERADVRGVTRRLSSMSLS